MENVKHIRGTQKGMIGECMFKATRRYAVSTKLVPKNHYIPFLTGRIPEHQIDFLRKNWLSLDCIELIYNQGKINLVLYEVKTKNYIENRPAHWKHCISQSEVNIYEEAKKLDINVKIAFVNLYENWEYDVKMEPFSIDVFHISVPRKYDKESWCKT